LTSAEPGKFVVIDGNSLLYRAFYALPPMQTHRGEHTNAVYGFLNMLLRLIEEEKPAYIAVAFDPPQPSFRVRIDASYKAQREKTPPELAEQFQKTREILGAMRIPVFVVDDYEADDVIGSLADLFAHLSHPVTVITGDADLLQLVGGRITVVLTKKGISQMERYDSANLKDHYGLTPEQFIEFKALKGDLSDNIPGVPGIGDKTARSLLEDYGTIDNIYEHIGELKGKMAANLVEYRDQLYTGRDLVTLRRDVSLDFDREACRYGEPDYASLIPLLQELEFKSLVARLKPVGQAKNEEEEQQELPGAELTQIEALNSLLEGLGEGDTLSLTVELEEGWPSWRQAVLALAFAVEGGGCFYLQPASLGKGEAEIWKNLAALDKKKVKVIAHNIKLWEHLFAQRGLKSPSFIFDSQLAAYLVDPTRSSYDLPALLQLHLGLVTEQPKSRKNEPFAISKCGPLLAQAAQQLFPLRDILQETLKEQELETLLTEIELPLAAVLARMECRGMTVDLEYLGELSVELRRRLGELEEKIYAQAGETFNLNSPQQLSKILFDKMHLPEIRKTKTGRSTDARVLEELALHHEIAELLLLYRQLAKLEGTYLSGLIELVDTEERKIYTTFNQASTATGRLSSSDPNLQNIPIRLEEGRRIRRAFIPSDSEKIFFAADYSQVELRILAHLSQDPILIEAFNTGQDIHRRTAAEVNGVDLEAVTPLMRDKAKAVNFGIIYGSSDYGLSQGLKIPRAEAKAYIENYFERYRGVKAYMDAITEQAREAGYVTTMLNRRRYLPEIHSTNHNIRSFAERMALNTPIQGSAADIIKLAMLKIDEIINEGGFKAAMLLQIHDELLFEIEESELDFFGPLIKREMEQAYPLSVPLQVDLKWGANWEELKKF
jgi:DNA polymerase I